MAEALTLSCVTCGVAVPFQSAASLETASRAFLVRHERCLTAMDLGSCRRLLLLAED